MYRMYGMARRQDAGSAAHNNSEFPTMDRLTSMRVFVAIAELEAFTAAADRLDMSRAAVSKYITDLEQHLGGRLFNRTTRKVSLTEAGHAYFTRCKQVLEDIEDAESVVSGLSSEPRGVLRLSVPMSFGFRQLAPIIADFHRKYPGIEVDLSLNDRIIDVVEEGYDLVLRITQPEDSSLVARRIADCRFAIAASPDYLKRHGQPQRPEDLSDHQCLQYSYAWSTQLWKLREANDDIRIRVTGPLTTNNGEMICAAAIEGMGICLLPTFICCDALRTGQLQQILSDHTPAPIGIYLVYPSSRLLSTKVRRFIDHTVECIGDNPAWDQ